MYKLTITKMVDDKKSDFENNLVPVPCIDGPMMYVKKSSEEKLTATLTDQEFQAIKKAILQVM